MVIDKVIKMPYYSINSTNNKFINLGIIGISIFLAWMLDLSISYLKLDIFWWIDLPSVLGFYGLTYTLFLHYFWKCSILYKLGIVRSPNLNGSWDVNIFSSYDRFKTKFPAILTITQNWVELSIVIKTETSKSHNTTASVIINDPLSFTVIYEYLNEPKVDTKKSMNIHKGLGRLHFSKEGKLQEGEYFNDRSRKTHGIIKTRLD